VEEAMMSTANEIVDLLRYLGYAAVVFLAGLGAFHLVRSFLPAYFSEKGKNLATMEDIGKITNEVESVKSQYTTQMQALMHQNNLLLEELRSRGQMRLVAAEKRLKKHQEAYTLWHELRGSLHNEGELYGVCIKCEQWWKNNSLYLSPDARKAFHVAYFAAHMHKTFIADRSRPDAVNENFARIMVAGDKIAEGAGLPPLGNLESESVAAVPVPTAHNT
jgi:hypothetical protein